MRPASALVSLHLAVALFGVAGLFGAWLVAVAGIDRARANRGRGRWRWRRSPSRRATRGGRRPGLALNGAVLALHWVAFFAAIQAAGVAVGLLGFASFPLVDARAGAHRGRTARRPTRPGRGRARRRRIAADRAALRPRRAESFTGWPGASCRARRSRGSRCAIVGSRARIPARAIALWQNAFAAACLVPVVALSAAPACRRPTPQDLGLVVALGVVCTALAHTLFVASLAACHRAHGERRRRARAGLRHRARRGAARRAADPRHARRLRRCWSRPRSSRRGVRQGRTAPPGKMAD